MKPRSVPVPLRLSLFLSLNAVQLSLNPPVDLWRNLDSGLILFLGFGRS